MFIGPIVAYCVQKIKSLVAIVHGALPTGMGFAFSCSISGRTIFCFFLLEGLCIMCISAHVKSQSLGL